MTTSGPKLNQPRKLGETESIQSLNHWKNHFRNYYRRCDFNKKFLDPATQWDPQAENHGFEDEGGPNGRSKETLAADLEGFFDTLASYMPYDYVTGKCMKETKNIGDVWKVIYEIYDAEITPASFLNYISLKKEPAETHRNFWNRLVGYVDQHLASTQNLTVEGSVVPAGGDKVSVTMLDLITMHWLNEIDPRLIAVVKVEFADDLKTKRISQLVKRIATSADDLLKRYETPKDQINAIQPVAAPSPGATATATNYPCEHDAMIRRLDRLERRTQRQRQREKNNKGRDSGRSTRGGDFCNHCDYINRKLGANLDTDHRKDRCPKKSFSIKMIQEEWRQEESSSSTESEGDQDEQLSDLYYLLSLQNDSSWTCPRSVVESRIRRAVRRLQTGPILTKSKKIITESHQSELSDPELEAPVITTPQPTEKTSPLVGAVQSSSYDWHNILRSDSPRLKCKRAGISFASLLDSGAVINVVDEKFADKANIPFEKTTEVAQAANHLPLDIVGQSVDPITVDAITNEGSVPLQLGKVLVIRDLGIDVLIGEPGKKVNNIVCWPKQETVLFADHMQSASYYKAKKLYTLARVTTSTTLFPGEEWDFQLPSNMAELDRVMVAPRPVARDWIQAGVLKVKDGAVQLKNVSSHPVKLLKSSHLVDIRDTIPYQVSNQVRFVVDTNTEDTFQYQNLGQTEEDPEKYLSECKVDPDGILTEEQRQTFRDINQRFARIITPRPGKYNGYYGHIDNRLHFSSKPAPNVRTHIPNYSPTMNKILAEKMDKLEEWGVLACPEKLGITVEHVQPSMLVPKKDEGEYRMVTDFSTINTYIKRVPTTSATMAQAKARIAKAEYVVHLDLSNYFYQNGMQKQDVQYLGTVHPFKGVRVYTCDPQGCKGASERGYEKLVRVYGDMIQDDRLAQMADGLHVLGQTVEEVTLNYIEVLNRAENAGFTFKPSAVIICPRNITLFGWDLRGATWHPTAHTISALVNAPRPVTVNQMRSFIGAFKQISPCIAGYAEALHNLDKVVGGRASAEKLQWTEELEASFDKARAMAAHPEGLVEPRPSDQLHTYSDWSESNRAVGGRLMIHRTDPTTGEVKILNGGYYSSILNKHKKSWLPCEGEAAGIRFVLEHFQHQIRESNKVTVHHTDSQPCVMAWKRSKRGAFSSSARIAAFLTGLSSLPIELQYTPGKEMKTSDYISRHPTPCTNPGRCQICSFTGEWEQIGDNASAIRSVTVDDIKAGRSVMPMIQRHVWLNIQKNDSTLMKLAHLIDTQQLPEKKKTKGDNTRLKLLHGQYTTGKLILDKDGLMLVKSPEGNFNGAAILVPFKLFMGVASALHIRLDHPSKAQLTNLVARYFYTPGWRAVIEEVTDNCHLCAAAKSLPAVLISDTNAVNKGFGSEFAADVIEREGQKILVVKEKLSQYVRARLIPNQTADTLRQEIISMTLDLIPDSGAVVRVDGATAFQALQRDSHTNGTVLNRLGLKIEVGRLLNKNKNAAVEIANKEIEKEILRLKESKGRITATELEIVMKNVNNRIRYHGLSSREIVFRRKILDNEEKNINDEEIKNKQIENKKAESKHSEKFKSKFSRKTQQPDFQVGDLVFLRSGRDKNKLRETFCIEQIEDEGTVLIRKYQSALRAKQYRAKTDELVRIPHHKQQKSDLACPQQPSESRPRRKAFVEARSKLRHKVKTIRYSLPNKSRKVYAWDTEDQDSDDDFYHRQPLPQQPRLDNPDEVEEERVSTDDDDGNESDNTLENQSNNLDISGNNDNTEDEDEEFTDASSRASSPQRAPHGPEPAPGVMAPSPGSVTSDSAPTSLDLPTVATADSFMTNDSVGLLREGEKVWAAHHNETIGRPVPVFIHQPDVLNADTLAVKFPLLFSESNQRSPVPAISQDSPEARGHILAPSPNSVDLNNVSNLDRALQGALQQINPSDTVQLGARAPAVNLDQLNLRVRNSSTRPTSYRDFHSRGAR